MAGINPNLSKNLNNQYNLNNNYNNYNNYTPQKAVKGQATFNQVSLDTVKTDGFVKTTTENEEVNKPAEEQPDKAKDKKGNKWLAGFIGVGSLIAMVIAGTGTGAFLIATGAMLLLMGTNNVDDVVIMQGINNK